MENQTIPRKENKMGVMPVNRLLLSMSIPMMLSMFVQALYNIVDSIFVSQISENALTAVSLAFPVQNLMIAVGVGTGVGVNALLSRSLGEKKFALASKAANNGILLVFLSFLAFAAFGIAGSEFYFRTQTDITEIVSYGTNYLSICCTFSFAMYGQVIFERLLQSTGKTFYSMIAQVVGAVVNMILDPIMIFGYLGFPRMEVAGAAVATVIGQSAAMLTALFFNIRKNHEITLSLRELRPNAEVIKKICSVGIPSVIIISIGSVMTYGLNRILLSFTATATAVFGVYFRLQSFVFMPVFGLNHGMVPIVAYNYGARKRERMVKTIKLCVTYAVSIMLMGLAVFQIMPGKLLMLFNATEEMLAIGIPSLRIISISFTFAGFCIIVGSVFQALGNGVLSMTVSVVRQLVVLLPAAYLLSLTGSVNAVWWSFPIAEIASMALSVIFMVRVYNKVIKPIREAEPISPQPSELVNEALSS
jgi:putative MATE family efflux protein